MKKREMIKLTALFLMLAVTGIMNADAEPVIGFGAFNQTLFLSDNVAISNDSSSVWVDAFSTTVHPRGYRQCVALFYSGEVFTNSSVQFRALIDDEVVEGDSPFFAYDSENLYETRSMNWWKCGLQSGDHPVKIQFKPFSNTRMGVRNRTLIIQY
jgi:hypothetical protein